MRITINNNYVAWEYSLMVLLPVTPCVLCEVWTKCLYIMHVNFTLQTVSVPLSGSPQIHLVGHVPWLSYNILVVHREVNEWSILHDYELVDYPTCMGHFSSISGGLPMSVTFIWYYIIQILKIVCSVTHTNIYSHFLSQKTHPTLGIL